MLGVNNCIYRHPGQFIIFLFGERIDFVTLHQQIDKQINR